MNKYFAIVMLASCMVVAISSAQRLVANGAQADPLAQPTPYSFAYSADGTDGSSSRQEQGDGAGRVQGFYTIVGADGRQRRVEYVADENGYRATIQTNEIGTKTGQSADAQYIVTDPSQQQVAQSQLYLKLRAQK